MALCARGAVKSLQLIEPEALTSDDPFAVSATMSIRRSNFICRFGLFTLSVTRYAYRRAPHSVDTPAPPTRGVRDLTCANGQTHDCSQEHVDADGSVGQAVTVGSKLRAIVVGRFTSGPGRGGK
jgi:hypothetical protein